MTELDHEALEGVRAWAQRRIDWRERHQRLAPVWDAISSRAASGETTAEFMAQPIADARRSLLRLEESVANAPQRQVEQEARHMAELARVRRRTAALRAWLEALS